MKHTISILVENHAGVLARIAGLFARRGYNIHSLAVGVTDNENVSRITIVGAVFLALIATLPTVLSVIAPESLGSIHFGGTSLLIAVGVALETVRQLENQMLMRNYQGFLK